MSDYDRYIAKVQADFNAGNISMETANRMINLAGQVSDARGNLGANDRVQLRYGSERIVPPPPDPTPLPNDWIGTLRPQPDDPSPIFFRYPRPRPTSSSDSPPPVPEVPTPPPAPEVVRGIKQATPDIIVFDEESIDPGFLVEAFFEEFGGTELINISRTDLINGDRVSYSPIVNLSEIYRKYNSNNIISIAQYQELPTRYGIDLLSREPLPPYFDENGDMIIEVGIVKSDESIEAEFALSGTISRIEQ